MSIGEWKAVVLTDAATEVNFLFHFNNKVCEGKVMLNAKNRNYLQDYTAEKEPAPAGGGCHAG